MKIAIAQLNFIVGAFKENTEKIIRCIESCKEAGADLVVFPELAVTGYPPHDLLEINHFLTSCDNAIYQISQACKGIDVILGAPSFNKSGSGKKIYNSAYFISDGQIRQIIHKTLLPDYDVFDECRYFEPNKDFETIESHGIRIALTICEDIWNIETIYYSLNPLDELIRQKPELIINISASPFSTTHDQERSTVLKNIALTYDLPIIYVNHSGAQTDIIFDGASKVLNRRGQVLHQSPYFKEDISFIEFEHIEAIPETQLPVFEKTSQIYQALITGIADYFSKMGFQKAVLGLSGGIDSAVVAVLLKDALGSENVKALLLPSMYSSSHSITDAVDLCLLNQIPYEVISINSLFKEYQAVLSPYFEGLKEDITEENLQARIRAVLLMAFSNKFGYILINTSNKSEMAVGYGTLYGDMCGGLSVLGDVYKTEVYELAHYINRENIRIPQNILTKAPSAELKPGQKDSDSLPEYEILDKILYRYIELKEGADQIIQAGFDEKTVFRVLKLVNNNEYKRYQAPPVLRISNKAFGIGRRMPLVGKY